MITFEYNGGKHVLEEIVGEDNIVKKDSGLNILKKNGGQKLLNYFSNIRISFTPIHCDSFEGVDVLHVFATASDENGSYTDVGEVSRRNSIPMDDGNDVVEYPVCILVNRARIRAIIGLLGLPVFSEEESPEFKKMASGNTDKKSIKEIDEKLNNGFSDEDRLAAYRKVAGDEKLTLEDAELRFTPKMKEKAAKILEEGRVF